MSYQKIILVGNLGKAPEMRYTPDGKAVTSLSVAVTKTWKGQDNEKKSRTTWIQVSCWGKLAENCNQYLDKGSKVLVEGELIEPGVWTNNETGKPQAQNRVNASNILFLSSSKKQQDIGSSFKDDFGNEGSPNN